MPTDLNTQGRLAGKKVLLTAAAQGIGRASAVAMAREGAYVIATDLRESNLADVGATEVRQLDVTDRDAVLRLADEVGAVDALFNCAGFVHHGTILDCAEADWDFSMELNVGAAYRLTRAFLPAMIEAGGGSIINLGSNSWWEAGGGFPAYATAKSAVHGLTRTMARDLGDHRIRVNTVVPGWIMTERQKELWATPEALEKHRARQCLPDLVEPVYVSRMVVFLASDDAAMCSANNYMVEAGSI